MIRTACLATVLLVSTSLALAEINTVEVEFPADINWVQVTEQSDADTYLREWIPSGAPVEDSDWLIVEQKFSLEKRTSARRYIRTMMNLARDACTDVRYNGPEKITVEKYKTYWARVICAKQHDKPYGAITELRVIAEGRTVFVVTSELRTAPTSVAGAIHFGDEDSIKTFFERSEKSAMLARESVRIIEHTDP